MTGALGALRYALATNARGPAMSSRELGALAEVLRERSADILMALAALALVGLIR